MPYHNPKRKNTRTINKQTNKPSNTKHNKPIKVKQTAKQNKQNHNKEISK